MPIDELINLSDEIEYFEEYFRLNFCSKCKDHEKEHHNVVNYPSGKIFCDKLRMERQKKFKKKIIKEIRETYDREDLKYDWLYGDKQRDFMKCYTRLIIDKGKKIIGCPNKPYGKLRQGFEWFTYCRSCYKFQLKRNPEMWMEKKLLKDVDD